MHTVFVTLDYIAVFVMIAADKAMYRHKDAYYDETESTRRKQ